MGYLDIPEWEIEEAIIKNPAILRLGEIFKNPRLVGNQIYLQRSERFIDMLFMSEDQRYIVVELKRTFIDDSTVVFNQLLPYKTDLALQLGISEEFISCVLATTRGVTFSLEQVCRQENIYIIGIDEKLIYQFLLSHKTEDQQKALFRLFKRRYPTLQSPQEYPEIEKSILHYLKTGKHNDSAKKEISILFKQISSKAPLCAHEVFNKTYERFSSESDHWFWIFYSVLDRRANAATFIKARKYLEKKGQFNPKAICDDISYKGKPHTIQTICDILTKSDFPLSSDSSRRELSMPTSIVEAALWFEKYGFSTESIKYSIMKRQTDSNKWGLELFEELKKNIYGVGDRIAGQIVRGFVLKAGWDWVINIPTLLEKCDFNLTFASHLRLGLVEEGETYCKDLETFGNTYLEGNFCIISHVLWYIRKRYCLKPKRCFECPLTGYCSYYYKSLFWQVPEYERTLFGLTRK